MWFETSFKADEHVEFQEELNKKAPSNLSNQAMIVEIKEKDKGVSKGLEDVKDREELKVLHHLDAWNRRRRIIEETEEESSVWGPREERSRAQVYTGIENNMLQIKKSLMRLGIPLPKEEGYSGMCEHMQLMRACVYNVEAVSELLFKFHDLNAPLFEEKVLKKKGDPGTFVIPCKLGNQHFDDVLCDTGASINVLSLELAWKIGATIVASDQLVSYGDSSTKPPYGKVLDYPLKIGSCVIPVDFTIIKMDPCSYPCDFLLGRPFLDTTGAWIDFINQVVVLERVSTRIAYPMKKKAIRGDIIQIEDDAYKEKVIKRRGSRRFNEGDCENLFVEKQSGEGRNKDTMVEKNPPFDPLMA